MQKTNEKEKILKEGRGRETNHFTYRGTEIRILADVSSETMQEKEDGVKYFLLKEQKYQLEFCIQRNFPSEVKERFS